MISVNELARITAEKFLCAEISAGRMTSIEAAAALSSIVESIEAGYASSPKGDRQHEPKGLLAQKSSGDVEPRIEELVFRPAQQLSERGQTPVSPPRSPAVPIEESITPDHIICLEDGKQLRMLTRYLRNHHNLTPDQYRQRWGLSADYPMVAPNLSAMKSAYARMTGLGYHRCKQNGARASLSSNLPNAMSRLG